MANKKYTIVASAYDKRNRLIYSCTNSYSDSSSLQRYYAIKAGHPERKFNHAELRCLEVAILKMKQKVDKLLIMRYDSFGNLKDCCPCEICRLCISDFDIREVLYSSEKGVTRYELR